MRSARLPVALAVSSNSASLISASCQIFFFARLGNQNYSHQLAALRCQQTPCTWALTGGFLPNALSLGPDGVISGPVQAGGFTATFTVQITDTVGDTASRVLKINARIPGCYSCHPMSNF